MLKNEKIFNSKIKASPVDEGLYIAFKHSISFATHLVASFGCYHFRTIPELALLLCRRLFLEMVVNFDLQLGKGMVSKHVDLILCHI